jgi:hypothetical protein
MAREQEPKRKGGGMAVLAIAAGIAMASGVHHGTPARGSGITSVLDGLAAAPAGNAPAPSGCCSPAWWAGAFLADAGLPRTACNMSAVEGWERAEGTYGRYLNPLDTTEREPGSWPVNPVGVQHYTSWGQGLHATVVTLYNGHYPQIIAALRAADSAQKAADAVGASVWGTAWYRASC